jgi:hypothetical protein
MASIPQLNIAIELIRLKARVPVVCSLLKGAIDKKTISNLYQDIHQQKSPSGQLPHQPLFYIHTYERRLQSSVLYVLYRKLIDNKFDHVYAISKSFALYKDIFKEESVIEFDRFWIMLTLVATNSIKLTNCPECNSAYIDDSMQFVDACKCPSCWASKKNIKKTRKQPNSVNIQDGLMREDMQKFLHVKMA